MVGVKLTARAFIPPPDYPPFVPFFDGGDAGDLYTVPMAGGAAVLVKTAVSYGIYQPVASPDYSQIAYLEFEGSGSSLKVCNADGTGEITLKDGSAGIDFRWPDWHPDGSHILYGTYEDDGGELKRINPDGTNDTLVYDATVGGMTGNYVHRAVYNRNGSKIAFIRGRQTAPPFSTPDDQLWVIDADGSNGLSVATLDSSADFGEMAVGWMHNSDVVAYHTSVGFVTTHWRVNADGTNVIELATGDTPMTHRRCWSLDDSTFYYLNFDNPSGHYTIWAVASDGSDLGSETPLSIDVPVAVFRPPPLVFPNGRIYFDAEDAPATGTIGLWSCLEDGSDAREEYSGPGGPGGTDSFRLESHF